MSNVAVLRIDSERESAPSQPFLGPAEVVEVGSPTDVRVRLPDGAIATARLALAFTYEPRPADVLLVIGNPDGHYVIGVLHGTGKTTMAVAGDVEVRVVGTEFNVTSTAGPAPRVEVSVQRGAVEVVSARNPGLVARVVAGQLWVQEAGVAPSQRAAPPLASETPTAALPAAAPSASSSTVAPERAPAAASSIRAGEGAPSARELFEQAGERRRAGDAAGAARAYEELLRVHPSDGRASLSAFELGRLRMDRLGDPAGAVSALERAVALGASSGFREDALARLVSVYAAQGNFAACGRARDRYLSSYPNGVHASAVASRCGGR